MKTPLQWLTTLLHTASSRAAARDVYPHQRSQGIGQDWSPTSYAEYYTKSVPIYAAIKVRADTLARVPLRAHRITQEGESLPLSPLHPLQRLLDRPNPYFTGDELIRATEIYLCLLGKAFWSLETINGHQEIWPLRPDHLIPLPGTGTTYIKGYIYHGLTGDVAYLPEEIVQFQYFNPLQDRTGLSPLAPLRLTADMAMDAIKYNRQTFKNGGIPDYLLFAEDTLTDPQVESFYKRWEARFSGPDKSHRPAIASGIKDMKSLAFSQREMEFIEGLRWSLEETSRVFGVPQPFLGSLREATLSNVQILELIFWRTTMIPETKMIQDKITNDALPKLGWENYGAAFDLSRIDVLTEQEEPRLRREAEYLDRGVITINEVRKARDLEPVPGGDDPDAPARRRYPRATPTPTSPAESQAAFHTNGAHTEARP